VSGVMDGIVDMPSLLQKHSDGRAHIVQRLSIQIQQRPMSLIISCPQQSPQQMPQTAAALGCSWPKLGHALKTNSIFVASSSTTYSYTRQFVHVLSTPFPQKDLTCLPLPHFPRCRCRGRCCGQPASSSTRRLWGTWRLPAMKAITCLMASRKVPASESMVEHLAH